VLNEEVVTPVPLGVMFELSSSTVAYCPSSWLVSSKEIFASQIVIGSLDSYPWNMDLPPETVLVEYTPLITTFVKYGVPLVPLQLP
jgi:hypothetical protein